MENVVCVIDVGSTALRMVILKVRKDGEYERLDRSIRPVTLGRDIFIERRISPQSMVQIIHIFTNFAELMEAWAITPEQAYVFATSTIREARNRDIFVDRIEKQTNFHMKILDGIEENHLTYIAVNHAVKNFHRPLSRSNSIIMEVGGGTTEMMLMENGKMRMAHNLRMGTLRLEQQFKYRDPTNISLENFIQEQMRPSIASIQAAGNLGAIQQFIMVGGDARLAARRIGTEQDDHYALIARNDFFDWVNTMKNMSSEEIVGKLGIGYNDVDGLLPALLIFKVFLEETSAGEIIVPDVSIREGILLKNVVAQNSEFDQDFTDQVIAFALNLAQHYHTDAKHMQRVRELSLTVYDKICSFHGLGNRERLYLEVSGILHAVGYFINQFEYHKHSQYIVANSEIFGLTTEEIQLVANIIRYQEEDFPTNSHPMYAALSRGQRLIIMKLAAILRLANALARNFYSEDTTIEMKDSTLFISGNYVFQSDRLSQQISFFEDVFGYKITAR